MRTYRADCFWPVLDLEILVLERPDPPDDPSRWTGVGLHLVVGGKLLIRWQAFIEMLTWIKVKVQIKSE